MISKNKWLTVGLCMLFGGFIFACIVDTDWLIGIGGVIAFVGLLITAVNNQT